MSAGHEHVRSLVERDAELTTLSDSVDELATGGRLLLIEGAAGIGKTELVDATVSYVCNKLDVSSRRQLGVALAG